LSFAQVNALRLQVCKTVGFSRRDIRRPGSDPMPNPAVYDSRLRRYAAPRPALPTRAQPWEARPSGRTGQLECSTATIARSKLASEISSGSFLHACRSVVVPGILLEWDLLEVLAEEFHRPCGNTNVIADLISHRPLPHFYQLPLLEQLE